jgi:hypothetical protein
VRIVEPAPTPGSKKKEREALAKSKLDSAKKKSSGESTEPRSTKKGRDEAVRKLSVLNSKKKSPGKMKGIMAKAKEQEALLKAALEN